MTKIVGIDLGTTNSVVAVMEAGETAADTQTAVDIHVLQGERPLATDNMTLGRFRLDGLPPAPRGIPQIEVTYDIDANGILHVSAQDKATGKQQNITITASTNLSKTEIERMVKEAERYAETDREHKALIEAKNLADTLVYQAEKLLRELGDKADATLRATVENKIAEVKKALEGNDQGRLIQANEALQQAMMQLGQAVYTQSGGASQQPQAQPNGHGTAGGAARSDDEDVVEGEFTQV